MSLVISQSQEKEIRTPRPGFEPGNHLREEWLATTWSNRCPTLAFPLSLSSIYLLPPVTYMVFAPELLVFSIVLFL